MFCMKVITSSQNSIVKHLTKLRKDASYRKKEGKILLEGKKIILEALKKHSLKSLLIPENSKPIEGHSFDYLKQDLAQKISSLKSCDGYFAEIQRPLNNELLSCEKILVIDHLQDPGNLGTLIRTALALNFEGIYIIDQSVDPFSPKVIRSSMGAALHIPIRQGDYQELQNLLNARSFHTFIANAQGNAIDKQDVQKPFALILGNEAKGPQIEKFSNYKLISIPIENVDSLNVAVAGSLLMYQLQESSCQ
ncbi:MAG: 23S rRNA (guanosine-2'-O-)-methyltransferase RlmB [Chlamydiae bacterium]|nr:23S rRNA (guanosine-2'-O-)-methyltransferase RlmB [Chlamydiota bacterium]